MKKTLSFVMVGMVLLGLSACGNQPRAMADITFIQPLSQVEWIEKTAAIKSAEVNNNSLMSMR